MFKKLLSAMLLTMASLVYAQQPQANDIPPTQPIFATNAKMVNGVAPGYWPTTPSTTGLILHVSAGTSFFSTTLRQNGPQTLTLTDNTTNYVYLNMTSGALEFNTSSFASSQFPIAVVVTSSGNITSILDVRTFFSVFGGGSCGPIGGDSTSTDCGTANRVGDTATGPANIQTYGFTNLTANGAQFMVGIGNNNLSNVNSNGGNDLAIGNNNGNLRDPNILDNLVAIGNQNSNRVDGETDIVAIGDQNNVDVTVTGTSICQSFSAVYIGVNNDFHCMSVFSQNIVGIGVTNFSNELADTPNQVRVTNGVGIGQNEFTYPGFPGFTGTSNSSSLVGIGGGNGQNMTNANDIVGIGDGSVTGNPFADSDSDIVGIGDSDLISIGNNIHDDIAIGNASILGNNNSGPGSFFVGNDDVAIGNHACAALVSGSDNICIGDFAGSIGWTSPSHVVNSNLSGSHNVWMGDDAGPNTTSQLDDTVAIGFNSHVTQSHEVAIGGTTTTLVILSGLTEINGGTNVVFRCATAGALPAGALTITAGSCGSTTDTGLRVQ